MKPDYASFGCLAVLSAGTAWTFGIAGHWLGSFISAEISNYAKWAGWIGGIALSVPILVALIPSSRKQMKLAIRDHDEQVVQEIHVINPRVIEVAMVGNTGPNLAIDLGDETILYLQGQWLYDADIYGAAVSQDDEGDELFNGLPAPHSFPCSEFTISRLPHSGEVLRIRVVGDYLQPEPAVEALKSEHEFQPSELFSGSIDDIVAVMGREHETRRAANKAVNPSGGSGGI